MTTYTHTTFCPYCGRENDRQTGPGDLAPGSLGVCFGCGEIAVFTDALLLRPMTNAEWLQLDAEQRRRLTLIRDQFRKGKTP